MSLDYHPALAHPAMSRYAATSPELLRWFKTYNAARDNYRDQVKPFGFLLSMMPALEFGGERIAEAPTKGRRRKIAKIKPIAPFETDREKAASMAFDRDSGAPVPQSALKSYTNALAQYHLSPESKFLNADYCDRGTTIRRHVLMASTLHIGKESHDWERQAVLGLNRNSEVAYGAAAAELSEKLQSFIADVGESKAAKALGISAVRLAALASGSSCLNSERWARKVAGRSSAALRLYARLSRDRQAELNRLREAVESDGLRETSKRLGVDPSNLRRKLNSHI